MLLWCRKDMALARFSWLYGQVVIVLSSPGKLIIWSKTTFDHKFFSVHTNGTFLQVVLKKRDKSNRFSGNTPKDMRQSLVDSLWQTQDGIPRVLISTKAGGWTNLTAACRYNVSCCYDIRIHLLSHQTIRSRLQPQLTGSGGRIEAYRVGRNEKWMSSGSLGRNTI